MAGGLLLRGGEGCRVGLSRLALLGRTVALEMVMKFAAESAPAEGEGVGSLARRCLAASCSSLKVGVRGARFALKFCRRK